jgi:hypothetical protein
MRGLILPLLCCFVALSFLNLVASECMKWRTWNIDNGSPSLGCQQGFYCSERDPTLESARCLVCEVGFQCWGGVMFKDPTQNTQRSMMKPCNARGYCPTRGMRSAKSCPLGYTNQEGSVTSETCTPCPKGTWLSGDVCIACVAGTYADKVGTTRCTMCPGGKYMKDASMTGSTALSDCLACDADQVSKPGSVGKTQCKSKNTYPNCEGGYVPQTPGATPIVCVPCTDGKYAEKDHSTCQDCAPGKTCSYYVNYGATSGVSYSNECDYPYRCTMCPAGTDNEAKKDQCSKCADGYYRAANYAGKCEQNGADTMVVSPNKDEIVSRCGNHYYKDRTLKACVACPSGKYYLGGQYYTTQNNFILDIVSKDQCQSCPAGWYNKMPMGQTSTILCTACNPGKYSDSAGSTTCKDCPADTYSEEMGSTECLPCEPGYESPSGGVVSASMCTACAVGRYAEQGSGCQACPVGTWSNRLAATEVNDCHLCPSGKSTSNSTAINGATSIVDCITCAAGKYVFCSMFLLPSLVYVYVSLCISLSLGLLLPVCIL